MILHRLAEQPSNRSRTGLSRRYFYALVVLVFVWIGLMAGGVVAIRSLVTLSRPAPPPASVAQSPTPSRSNAPSAEAFAPEPAEPAVPWHMLGAIAFCCAMGTLMISQRLNPPTRSLRRGLSRTQSRKL